ncbi:MAG: dihydropteroate synthase [Chthonomonas sp.]|nr:dihydropteroate synthase [Chthonomonas sp.]
MSQFELPADRPAIMGILNVTPDSFSDGGLYQSRQAAIAHALSMRDQGADVIDIGGESTRPGAAPVEAEVEIARTIPVVTELANRGIPVSIDTSKAAVAKAAIEAGAHIVNDVTALSDPAMAELCNLSGCTVCLMHMQGTPRTMQLAPAYQDVVAEVLTFLLQRARRLALPKEQIWIDPGIGFGKTTEQNLALIRATDVFVASGYPVLVGISRKSFLGRILGTETEPAPLEERLEGSLVLAAQAQLAGARILRVHDVAATRRAVRVTQAFRNQQPI